MEILSDSVFAGLLATLFIYDLQGFAGWLLWGIIALYWIARLKKWIRNNHKGSVRDFIKSFFRK